MKIDVTVATLNSSKTIFECLNSIQQNVPCRKIVVVDGGSIDGTIEIASSHGAEVISAPGVLLGETRYLQALHCEADWIAFVDSDVYINEKWWPAVKSEMRKRVGVVNSRCLPKCSSEEYFSFFQYLWHSRPHPRVNVSFSNSLTRRDLLLQCEQIRRVHAGEDGVFFRFVKGKGLETRTVSGYLAYHDNDIYHHHPFAHYRLGRSVKTQLFKIPLLFYRRTRQWLNYSKRLGSFQPILLKYLYKLCVHQSAGVLSKFRHRVER